MVSLGWVEQLRSLETVNALSSFFHDRVMAYIVPHRSKAADASCMLEADWIQLLERRQPKKDELLESCEKAYAVLSTILIDAIDIERLNVRYWKRYVGKDTYVQNRLRLSMHAEDTLTAALGQLHLLVHAIPSRTHAQTTQLSHPAVAEFAAFAKAILESHSLGEIQSALFRHTANTNLLLSNTMVTNTTINNSSGDESVLDRGLLMCDVNDVMTQSRHLNSHLSSLTRQHRMPHHIQRFLGLYTLSSLALLASARFLYLNSSWAGSNNLNKWSIFTRQAVGEFVREHVTEPAQGIASELLMNRKLASIHQDQLASSGENLRVMIEDFARRNYPDMSEQQLTLIREQARHADINTVMGKYISEMSSPILGIVKGELIPAILIQLQKLKLEIETEMVSVDKLMRANELNLMFLATIPALIVAAVFSLGVRMLLGRFSSQKSRWRVASRENARQNLRNVERSLVALNRIDQVINSNNSQLSGTFLSFSESERFNQLVEVGSLVSGLGKFEQSCEFLRESEKASVMEDVCELRCELIAHSDRLGVVGRMYRTHEWLANRPRMV